MPPPLPTNGGGISSSVIAEGSRLRRRPTVVLRSPTAESVAIYCGAPTHSDDDNFEDEYDEHRPGTVQILLEDLCLPPPRLKSRARRSNGCGTLAHGAVRHLGWNTSRQWHRWSEGLAATVVELETVYFSEEIRGELGLEDGGRSACGCVVKGVGCAIWWVLIILPSILGSREVPRPLDSLIIARDIHQRWRIWPELASFAANMLLVLVLTLPLAYSHTEIKQTKYIMNRVHRRSQTKRHRATGKHLASARAIPEVPPEKPCEGKGGKAGKSGTGAVDQTRRKPAE